jgi:hypothetical protein
MFFPVIAAEFGLFFCGDFRSLVWNTEEAVNEAEISIQTFALPYIYAPETGMELFGWPTGRNNLLPIFSSTLSGQLFEVFRRRRAHFGTNGKGRETMST